MKRLAVLVLVLLLVLGVAVYRGTDVEIDCSPTASTPMLLQAVDGADTLGEIVADLTDGDTISPVEVVQLMGRVGGALRLLWDTATASAQGDDPPKLAEGLRRDTRGKQRDALLSCCAEWAKQQNPPPGTPGPEQGDDGTAQPWDPRMASLSLDGQPVDCSSVVCEAPGTVQAISQQRARYSSEQREIARVAAREVRTSGIPQRWQRRAVIVALAAGFQESGVRNLPYGHSSSVGWLQLIQMHGTHAQRMDPAFSVRWFYRELQSPIVERRMKKPWTQLSVNDAAQGAQGSGFPDAYGKWRDDAERLLEEIGEGERADCVPNPVGAQAAGAAAPARWNFGGQRTVDQAVAWMREQDERNTTGWYYRCLAAVRAAYGHSSSAMVNGHFYAIDVWRVMPARYRVPGSSPPPKGALVFWDTGAAAGHIAISNGDGRAWTTDPPGRKGQIGLVSLSVLDTWGTRLGYGAPVFPQRTRTGEQA